MRWAKRKVSSPAGDSTTVENPGTSPSTVTQDKTHSVESDHMED